MNRKNKIIIYVFILLTLVGCKSKSYNKNSIKKKDIAPKSLKELNQEISSIMDYVGDIEKINLGIDLEDKDKPDIKENKSEAKDEEKKSGEEKAKQSEDDISSQNLEKTSDKDKETKDEATKQNVKNEKIESNWKDINKSLETLYTSWNEYGVKAIKKGATAENIGEIEDSLNKLTKGVEDKEILTVYNYGSKSLKSLKPMYGPYRDEIGGETSTLKYMVYQYYINGMKNSTNTALLFIADSEDEINKIRLKWEDEKNKGEKIDKVSFGFNNLSKSLDENSIRLLILKKDALIKNINSLEN